MAAGALVQGSEQVGGGRWVERECESEKQVLHVSACCCASFGQFITIAAAAAAVALLLL